MYVCVIVCVCHLLQAEYFSLLFVLSYQKLCLSVSLFSITKPLGHLMWRTAEFLLMLLMDFDWGTAEIQFLHFVKKCVLATHIKLENCCVFF